MLAHWSPNPTLNVWLFETFGSGVWHAVPVVDWVLLVLSLTAYLYLLTTLGDRNTAQWDRW